MEIRIKDPESHYILQDRVPALLSRIEKINQKLAAAKAPLIQLAISDAHLVKMEDSSASDYMAVVKIDLSREIAAPIGLVTLLATTKIDPVTQFMEHTTFTKLSAEEDFKIKNPGPPCFCDHCETNRIRSYIHTLKTPIGLIRVGSGCLDQFTGFKMSKWHDAYKLAIKALVDAEAISFTEANEHAAIPVELFLCEAIDQIEQFGYMTGYSHGVSTGFNSFQAIRGKMPEIEQGEFSYSDSTKSKATEVRNYLIDTETDPAKRSVDYYSNLRGLLGFGFLTIRQAGLLASLVKDFDKDLAIKKERENKSALATSFYGTVGERIPLKNLRVDYVKEGSNEYGYTTELTMYNPDGYLFVWKASGMIDVKKNDVIHLVGKLENHRTWDSAKLAKTFHENRLSRCKFHTLEEIEEIINKPAKKPRNKRISTENEIPAP